MGRDLWEPSDTGELTQQAVVGGDGTLYVANFDGVLFAFGR